MFFTKRAAELSRLRMENTELREQNKKLRPRKTYIKAYDVNMLLSSIKIPKSFGTPHAEKLAKCEAFYQQHGVLDRKIIVHKGYCIDGYIGLLTLLAAGVTTAKVLKIETVTVWTI